MGIMDFFKNEDDQDNIKPKSEEPYSELSTGLDDFENPSWQQIESALSDIDVAEDSFTTLSFINYGLEVDTIQCVKTEEGYTFEALPAMETNEYGKIYHLDQLDYEEVLRRFEEFFETQEISGYKAFQKDSFE